MSILFLIPARGGSKELPGKNLARVGGIPLVGRAARTARQAGRAFAESHRVVCSTDDQTIAGAAREWGAETPFIRPAELATDTASSIDVVLHALDALGESFETVVLVQPTSPLVEPGDVIGVLSLHRRTGLPVVTVCPGEHPIEWQMEMDGEGQLVPLEFESRPLRRQDAIETFRLNGAVYAAGSSFLRESKRFIVEQTLGYVMPTERSVDVDAATDLAIAEAAITSRTIEPVDVAGRMIGPGKPCFIIAEAGVNHNGRPDLALELVDAAAKSGADAVKFQTFKAEKVATRYAPKAAYQKETTSEAESQFEMIKKLELSEEHHREIERRCREKGILFMSTPFDEGSADFLESLGIQVFKMGSGELTNLPFIRYVARKGRPVIVSTGMSKLSEVHSAVEATREEGLNDLILLHCVSNYPAAPANVNLMAMDTMAGAFGVPIGYSDHTRGIDVSLAAVARGACVIEKHFTIDRGLEGPDHRASMEPAEMTEMIEKIRIVEMALGNGEKRPAKAELDTARVARRSLVALMDIPLGSTVDASMIGARRPGGGMDPDRIGEVLGRRIKLQVNKGTLFLKEMFE